MELKNMNIYILTIADETYRVEYIGQKRELEGLIFDELEHDGTFRINRFLNNMNHRERLISIIRI